MAAATVAAPAASPIRFVLDGQEIATDAPPCVVDGRVLVPLRMVAEAFGCAVAWDPAAQTITVNSPGECHPVPGPDRGPSAPIPDEQSSGGVGPDAGRIPRLIIDGFEVRPEPPPRLLGARLMVPLRLIAEYLGFDVSWQPTSRTVAVGWGGPYLEVHFIGESPGPGGHRETGEAGRAGEPRRAGEAGAAGGSVSAVLIELPDGQNVLMVTAAAIRGEGGRAVLAYLAAEGVVQLNWVVVPRSSANDNGGLGEVIRSVPVGKVLTTELLATALGEAARAHGVEVLIAQPGMTLVRGCDSKGEGDISVIVASALHADGSGDDRSAAAGCSCAADSPIVLHVSYGHVNFLLDGSSCPPGVPAGTAVVRVSCDSVVFIPPVG